MAKKEGNFSMEELALRQKSFGTIVLECDLDTTCDVIYTAYYKRWQIEIVGQNRPTGNWSDAIPLNIEILQKLGLMPKPYTPVIRKSGSPKIISI